MSGVFSLCLLAKYLYQNIVEPNLQREDYNKFKDMFFSCIFIVFSAGFVRPVVLLGPIADITRDKLLQDMPDIFAIPSKSTAALL